MGQELQIPDSFKNRQMAPAFQAALNAAEDNLSDGIGQSYGVIGYKGKQWSLRYRGEKKLFLDTQGFSAPFLDVIILGQAKAKSKSFYKKFDPNTSDGDRPLCSSIDGIVPDLDVVAKQCESCALCPRNVWKTDATTGRKGRECTDYKRLAVLILPTQTTPLLGSPLLEGVFLRVPPDSLNSLAIMGETMANQGYHYSSYITRISFDQQKAHPCMVFRPLQGLSEQEAPVILDLRKDPSVGRITGGDVAVGALKAVEQALAAPGSNVTGLGATVTQQPSSQVQQSQPVTQQPQQVAHPTAGPAQQSSGSGVPSGLGVGTGLGTAGAAQPATQSQPTSVAETGTGLTGLGLPATGHSTSGGASTASATSNQLQTGLQTVADVGEAEASDDELDARIAGLIKVH